MYEQVLSGQTKRALAVLGKSRLLKDGYLAGGTALALQIGHRVSLDLDFFTLKKFDVKTLTKELSKLPIGFSLERLENNTLLGYLDKAKFSLFFYEYPLIDKTKDYQGIKLASLKDIATMKLLVVSDRGAKRDFIDLYYILAIEKLFSLRDVFLFYDSKFKSLKQNQAHLIRSLTYFADAENTNVPRMFFAVNWREVKKFFEKETKDLLKNLIYK